MLLALFLTVSLAGDLTPAAAPALDPLLRSNSTVDPGVDPLLHPPAEEIGGLAFDFSAAVGLAAPPGCGVRDFAERLAAAAGGASPTRPVYRYGDIGGYPHSGPDTIHEYVGRVPVTVVVLPGENFAVARPAGEAQANAAYFTPAPDPRTGPRGRRPLMVPPPAPIMEGVSPKFYGSSESLGHWGRLVERTREELQVERRLREINFGRPGGAELLGYVRADRLAEGNPRLLRAKLERPGRPAETWETFAVADASGLNRTWSKVGAVPGLGPYTIPAQKTGEAHPLGRHRLWRLPYPTPAAWSFTGGEALTLDRVELEREPVWILASRREPAEPLIASYALVPAADWNPEVHGAVEVIAVRACTDVAAAAAAVKRVAQRQPAGPPNAAPATPPADAADAGAARPGE